MLAPLAGVPGGIELLIVGLVSLLLFSPLVALVYLLLFRRRFWDADEQRLADLESEVAELRARLDEPDGDRREAAPPPEDGSRAVDGDDSRRE